MRSLCKWNKRDGCKSRWEMRRELVINWCTGLLGLPQTEWHKQQKFIFSQSGRLEVQGQGVSRVGFSRGFSSWLTRDSLSMVFPLSICVLISFFYKSHWIRVYPDDFISSYLFKKSSVPVHSPKHQALGFQHTNFGGDAFQPTANTWIEEIQEKQKYELSVLERKLVEAEFHKQVWF